MQKAVKILDLVGSFTLPPEEYPWEELENELNEVAFKNTHYEGRSSAFGNYPESMTRISNYYTLHNQDLAQLLGEEFPLEWNSHPGNH